MLTIEGRSETPLATKMHSISVNRLADGRCELIADQSTLKTLGKGKWHRETVSLTLSADEVSRLCAAITA